MNDYGFSSDPTLANDKRQEQWKKEREERGFDSTEVWSLDYTIAKFILPRLKAFKENTSGITPCCIDPDDKLKDKGNAKWKKILQEMIDGFDIIVNDEDVYNKEKMKKKDRAIKLFAKHYFNLWI